MQDEKWLPIADFPDYEVSDHGRVRFGGEPVRTSRSKYLVVNLKRDGKTHLKRVHRLVLESFVGPCPDGMEACHDPDRDRYNCRLSNLRWDTRLGNVGDMQRHGTVPSGDRNGSRLRPDRLPRGVDHWTAREPERVPRGDAHYSSSRPGLAACGDQNGSRTHPERLARGERHGASKLSDADALEIVRSLEPAEVLAVRYRISREQVGRIRRGASRKHLQALR